MTVAYCANCGLERPVEPLQKWGTCYKCGPMMRLSRTRPEPVDWPEVITSLKKILKGSCIRVKVRI